jgi:hypothetical protein
MDICNRTSGTSHSFSSGCILSFGSACFGRRYKKHVSAAVFSSTAAILRVEQLIGTYHHVQLPAEHAVPASYDADSSLYLFRSPSPAWRWRNPLYEIGNCVGEICATLGVHPSAVGPASVQFKGEISDAFARKRHQRRYLEFCTALLRSRGLGRRHPGEYRERRHRDRN